MIKHLRLLLAAILMLLVAKSSFAQVTLISDNTNINGGFVLPNGRPLMISDAGLIYTTNGTTASVITNSVLYNNDSSSAGFYKGDFYFTATNPGGKETLWATDATSGGTHAVKQVNTTGYSDIDNFFVFNNLLYFTADDGVHGYELWSTDGTSANTKLVTDINGKASSSITDTYFFINGSYVLFSAYNSDSTLGLYKLTSSGVSLVKNNFADDIDLESISGAAVFGNKVVFTADNGDYSVGNAQLWITDGTTTTLVKDFGDSTSGLLNPDFYLFKNKLFFSGPDNQLWTTDGTAANTILFKNFGNNGYGFVELFEAAVINSKLIFTVYDSTSTSRLWITDGTTAGTALLKDVISPVFLFNEGALQSFYESANLNNFDFHQLYNSFKGKLYFTAFDSTHGFELWNTDGTTNGTAMVKDINPGVNNGVVDNINSFFTTTGIYFNATNGISGFEPWVTDGTDAGTKVVADIKSGSASSNPSYQFIYNSQLYLLASNSGTDTDLYKINTPLTILPVNLSNFAASLQPSSVLLNWQTATEVNTDHFGVERSVDGIHFNNIGNVAATGTSNSTHNYTYNDYSALHLGSSTLYYRLKTIDKDGKYTYSSIIKLQLHDGKFEYSLSPNPVRSQLTVSFTTVAASSQISLRITDVNGKPVYEKSLQGLQAGSVQQYINVAGLASGIYYIQLITDNDTKTLKFVKQ